MKRLLPVGLAGWALLSASPSASAAEFGVHVSALKADINISGIGLNARWRLRSGWFVNASLNREIYHFERTTSRIATSDLENIVAGVAVGHANALGDNGLNWFWTWGLAAGFPTIGRSSGNARESHMKTATEIHLTAAVGISKTLSDRWSLNGAAQAERRFVDWRVLSDDSEILEKYSELSPVGVQLSLSYRF